MIPASVPPGTGNGGPIGALRYRTVCNRGVTETGSTDTPCKKYEETKIQDTRWNDPGWAERGVNPANLST